MLLDSFVFFSLGVKLVYILQVDGPGEETDFELKASHESETASYC